MALDEKTRWVGISLGNLSGFTDGIGEFSFQLCSRLAAQAPALREQHGVELCFHARPSLHGVFGEDVRYLAVQRSQEFLHRQPQAFALWHTLSQLNRYRPPAGTGQRLATLHDLNYAYFKNGFSQWRDARRVRRLLARTDRLVTISQYVAADVGARLHWRGATQVIYNGARDLASSPQQSIPDLPADGFLFHLSRMSPSKNVAALLGMARAWPQQRLVLAGPSGPDHSATREQVARQQLHNVTLLHDINDQQKAWLYAHCQAFVFPSITEGFGLPPAEALHFGKPVFLSRLTSLPEVGGAAAFYWTDFDPLAMRRQVESSLAHWNEAASAQARRQAAQFNWDRCANAYVQAYQAALSPGHRAPSNPLGGA